MCVSMLEGIKLLLDLVGPHTATLTLNNGNIPILEQRQRLGAVVFGKLCGTASAQKGILRSQVR